MSGLVEGVDDVTGAARLQQRAVVQHAVCRELPDAAADAGQVQRAQLGLTLAELRHVAVLERGARVRLVDRHHQLVLHVLDRQVLAHGLELVQRVCVVGGAGSQHPNQAGHRLYNDWLGPDDAGRGCRGQPEERLLQILARPLDMDRIKVHLQTKHDSR